MKIRNIVVLGLLSGTAFPAAALAQPAEAAITGTEGGVEDIIVTARRRNEGIQETPIAITAITPAQLEVKGSLNIGDLNGTAPNVLITEQNSGNGAANISIRGLAFADVEKSIEPTVAVVIDGVPLGTSTGQFLDFFDIAQIEVLRGPQGTLFGRNTIGGVLNIRRTRPTGQLGAKVQLDYGSFNSFAGRAVVNAPITDTLSAKGFFFHRESDGYYRNGVTGKRDGGSRSDNFGLALLFEPSPDFNALLTVEKQNSSFEPATSNISKSSEDAFCAFEPAGQCDRNQKGDLYTVFSDRGFSRAQVPAATLEMTGKLGGITITSVTGYREAQEHRFQDFDASSANLYELERWGKFHQFSQEFRAAGKIGTATDFVVGAYFYDGKYRLRQATDVFGAPAPLFNVVQSSKSYALFGDVDIRPIDRVRISIGGRYTDDRKRSRTSVAPSLYPEARYSGRKFTPKVGLDYRPNEQVMVYGSWSRGYRAGGISGFAQSPLAATTPYKSENVDSFEAGIKTTLFDRHLLFNVAGFYSKYKDLQQNTNVVTTTGTGTETLTTNVGAATIKGLEADMTARLTSAFTVTGSLGLLRSHFKNFLTLAPVNGVLTTFDYSKNHLIYNPRTTASINATYVVPLAFGDLNLNAGYRYIAPYDQAISMGATTVSNGVVVVQGNDPRARTDKQTLLDLAATVNFTLAGTTAHVGVYGRNILDDRGTNAEFIIEGLWSFATAREPRVFGVRAGFDF